MIKSQSPLSRSSERRHSLRPSLRWLVGLSLAAATIPSIALAPHVEAAPPMTVGFIYVGPKTDYGYNQAHAEGAAALAKMPGVKIREEEMVPETVAVQKTMESMINLDGATLLFPTSFGYFDPHILKRRRRTPR